MTKLQAITISLSIRGIRRQTTYNRVLDFKSNEIDTQDSTTIIISHNSPLKLLSLVMNNKSNLDYFELNDLPYAGITLFSKNDLLYKEHGIIFKP